MKVVFIKTVRGNLNLLGCFELQKGQRAQIGALDLRDVALARLDQILQTQDAATCGAAFGKCDTKTSRYICVQSDHF